LRHVGRYYVTLLLNRELVNTKRNYAWLVILQILSKIVWRREIFPRFS